MKDKYGVELEVGDIVVINDECYHVFERGIIEEIVENKSMGYVISETAVVNYGKLGVFYDCQIIHVDS